MKIKKLLALLVAVGLLVSFAACNKKEKGEEQVSSAPQEVVDPNFPVSLGEIRIAEKPKRVVSLSPALTEIIFELGAGDRLAGVSDFCDYPSDAEGLPRCGTSQLPNLEELEGISAQVVFSSATLSQQATVKLQQMGAEVVVLPPADSMDGIERNYLTAATVLDGMVDGEANGKAVFTPLRQRFDALTQAAQGIEKRYSGIYLRMVPLTMATGDTFEGKLLAQIGIDNDAGEYTQWIYPEDKAVDLYPDLLFYDQSIDPQYFKDTKIYNTTDAVKQGRLFAVDATAFERQSARMFDQLTEMFKAAYPDIEIAQPAPAEVPSQAASSSQNEASSGEDDEILDLSDATQIH